MPAPADAAASVTPTEGAADDDVLSGPAWSRHRLDLARLVLAAGALALGVSISLLRPAPARSVSVSLVDLVVRLPPWSREALIGTTQVLALLVPAALVAFLVRAPRLLATALASAVVAGLAMAALQRRIAVAVPRRVELATTRESWIFGAAFPSGAYLAAFTAVVIVLGPVLSRGWRRVGIAGLALASVARIVTAVAVPLNVVITVALGAVVGSAALAVLGSPRRTVSRREVLGGLGQAGLRVTTLEPASLGAGHGQTFRARTDAGQAYFVKLLGRDERSADQLVRILRRLRVKGLEDDRPGWSPADVVENEGLSTLLAAQHGVAVPAVEAVGTTAGGDGLLALAVVDGCLLSELSAEQRSDEVLDEAWRQLGLLHHGGIAHRWFSPSHLVVSTAGHNGAGPSEAAAPTPPGRATVTVLDLRWAVRQADDDVLAADVAALLVGLALLVGTERAVASAVRSVETAQLRAALPLLQPLVLPEDVREDVRRGSLDLAEVGAQLQSATGADDYELATVERIGPRHLLAVFGVVALTFTLLPLASNWSDIAAALSAVGLAELPALLVLAPLPYLIGAATIMSVVTRPLPYAEVVRLMAAQSFLNRFTPANAGGMTLRVRYLQKRGVAAGEAAAGMVLTAAASLVGQVVVIATFAAWAGADGAIPFSVPRASTVAVALLGVGLLAGLGWLTPLGRRLVIEPARGAARSAWRTLRTLLGQPARFLTLFGTTVLNKSAVILAFVVSCRALDVGIAFSTLGLLYLTASTVASAAPTPGGLGAVEAALVAALTGADVAPAEALSAVFVFRLATYWLPVPFGWWALRQLHRSVLA